MKFTKLILILLTSLAFVSCGGTFQPPVITSEGYILSEFKSPDGGSYYIGSNLADSVVLQWTQADGTKARAIKPKSGNITFYIFDGKQWNKVGAKEPNPTPPAGSLDKLEPANNLA